MGRGRPRKRVPSSSEDEDGEFVPKKTKVRRVRRPGAGRRKKKNQEGEDDQDLLEVLRHRQKQATKHLLLQDELDQDPDMEYREEGGSFVGDIYIPPKATREEAPLEGVRLIIEKIVCENFKSYAGIKELGPFHRSFSAIIGPNGNGKSNIIDAMLFVFGYRASKLRSKKLSILIHNSDLLTNVESCSVTVVFAKILDEGPQRRSDDLTIIPNSRITVQRVVYSNNDSVYYLNERRVRFQDVASFLQKKGIDIVHNRFLILQGEVETIATMKPKSPNGQEPGLLEYLEDIIGTRRYIKCLGQLESRVDELDYEREVKLLRVDLVEREKIAMEGPVKKAKDYLRTQNAKTRAEHQLYQFRIREFSKKLAETESKKTELEFELNGLNKRLEEIEKINEERKEEFERVDKAWKKVEKEYGVKSEKLKKAIEDFEKYKTNLKHANELRKKAKADIERVDNELANIEELPKKNEHDIEKFDKRREELQDIIKVEEDKIREPLAELRIKAEGIKADLEGEKGVLSKMKRTYAEINKKYDSSDRDLRNYKEAARREEAELEKRQNDLDETRRELANKESQSRESFEGKEGPLRAQLQKKQREKAEINQKFEGVNQELEVLQGKYNEAKEGVEGFRSNDGAYKCFMVENRISGVYGRFKDLGKIDEKYNVAATVSTGFLDHWIVDTDSTASVCINLLKENRLPFQNFICLNKCWNDEKDMNRGFKAPAGSHRIFDLISVSKPELKPVFYKAFKNTLVCDDLDLANKVAFYGNTRHRVSTLRGEIVNPSGSMTGGGFKRITGAFNTNMALQLEQMDRYSAADVKSFKAQLASKQSEYEELSIRSTRISEEEYQLNKELKRIISDAQSFQSDVNSLKAQIPLKEKRLAEQTRKFQTVQIDPKVLQTKESDYAKFKAEKEAFEGPYEAKIDRVKELTAQLKEYQDTRRKKLEETVNKYISTLKKVEDEKRRKVLELKNIENNRVKLQEKKKRLEEEILKIQEEMSNWFSLKKAIEEQSDELVKAVASLQAEREKSKAERDKLKAALDEFVPEKKKLSKKRAVTELDLGHITKDVEKYGEKLKGFQELIENLELKEIPKEIVPPLEMYSDEILSTLKPKDLEHQIHKLEGKLKHEIPNLSILDEYKSKVEEFIERVKELDEATEKRDMFRDAYLRTTLQRVSEFMEAYGRISSKVKELFRMISLGGDAELALINPDDPFDGIVYRVRPTLKSWKKISNLSGGEKTLSSLALVFALHYFKPSPFYVLDEIDAALDFKNVSIIANYIKERTQFTQFIVISLRSNMFELADSLFGVFKVESMSYCLHFQMNSFLAKLQGLILERSRRVSGVSSRFKTPRQSITGSGVLPPTPSTPFETTAVKRLFASPFKDPKDPTESNVETPKKRKSPLNLDPLAINPSAIAQLQQSQLLKESEELGPEFVEERGAPSFFALNVEAQRDLSESQEGAGGSGNARSEENTERIVLEHEEVKQVPDMELSEEEEDTLSELTGDERDIGDLTTEDESSEEEERDDSPEPSTSAKSNDKDRNNDDESETQTLSQFEIS